MRCAILMLLVLGACVDATHPFPSVTVDGGATADGSDEKDSEGGSSTVGTTGEPCDNAWCVDRCEKTCEAQFPDGTHDDSQAECFETCGPQCADQCVPDELAVCEMVCATQCVKPIASPWTCSCHNDSHCPDGMSCTFETGDLMLGVCV